MSSTIDSILAALPRQRPQLRITRDLLIGAVLGLTLTLSSASLALWMSRPRWWTRGWEESVSNTPLEGVAVGRTEEKPPVEIRSNEVVQGLLGLIGNTPLIRINSLSDALGVEILGKAEFLNPGGSVKDRVALKIIENAEAAGILVPHTGCKIFEGTVGSTGISIATVGRAKGYDCCIIMPDDVAIEKVHILETLGADVVRVRPASIIDEKQFVNLARAKALEFGHHHVTPNPSTELQCAAATDGDDVVATIAEHSGESDEQRFRPRGFFADQFENHSNYEAHYQGTGPEIWKQTRGNIDAFVSGAGTGGSLSGTATYLKQMNPQLKVVLSDPQGSGLYNRVKYGVMFDVKEKEGRKRRHQVDTVVEGIGINRLTHNFLLGEHLIDDAYRVTDEEAVAMSRYLNNQDGLVLGSSSACNLVASVRLAKKLPKDAMLALAIKANSGLTNTFEKMEYPFRQISQGSLERK